jgi:glycosyltransferase involved in cell wall biosynthesis
MSKAHFFSISIAMATYNGAKYIREQLDDLAAQTRAPAELVVCDDQSSDNTFAIVEDFAASAPFPVHIHRNSERLGFRANFMKCAGLCSSDLIAFCDQDDHWDLRKLETLAAPFANEEVLLAYHNARVVDGKGRTLGLVFPSRKRQSTTPPLEGRPWFFPMGFTQMFRRSLTAFDDLWSASCDHDEEGQPLAHDRWYFFLAGGLGSVEYVPALLANYRQHGTNTYGLSWFRTRVPALTELWHATHKRKLRLQAAECRARIFRQISERLRGESRERSSAAAGWYDQLADLIGIRSEFYDANSVAGRVSALRRLVGANAYGSEPSRFPRLTLAFDATFGLLGAFPLVEGLTRRLARH